jgi:hypothetical protein
MRVEDALKAETFSMKGTHLRLIDAADRLILEDYPVSKVLARLGERPLLVISEERPKDIRGIPMEFDLL